MGVCADGRCYLCQQNVESHDHLFFGCEFSSRCLQIWSNRSKVQVQQHHVWDWWVQWRCRSGTLKKLVAGLLNSLMYHVWWARNRCYYEQLVVMPEVVVSLAVQDMRMRVNQCMRNHVSDELLVWVNTM
ncbi:hypothetical protein RND81_14G198400 [Saponaria officinalis]|uniref:Reverse transcriptase zinc-binding domain-containing protein n=1 Tax=Saponaria officinalis TaxID=3572 RepID=A0AAW1GP13_SAPOF